jgi:hypothetical protein
MFGKACRLGLAIACTNHAAGTWASNHTEDELACAQRTFSKACDVAERFACGMPGRLAFESCRTAR